MKTAAVGEAIPGSCEHATAQQNVNFCTALKASAIGAELERVFLAEIAHEKGTPASDGESLGRMLDARIPALWRMPAAAEQGQDLRAETIDGRIGNLRKDA